MKIDDILKMTDVDQIHNFVKLMILENTVIKNVKFNIFNYAAKKHTRTALTGVLHEEGFRVSTDGFILVRIKEDYPQDFEGSIIDRSGQKIEVQYVNYKNVIKDSMLGESVELKEAELKEQFKKYKAFKKTDPHSENPYFAFSVGDKKFNTEFLHDKFLPAAKIINGETYIVDNVLFNQNENGEVVLQQHVIIKDN